MARRRLDATARAGPAGSLVGHARAAPRHTDDDEAKARRAKAKRGWLHGKPKPPKPPVFPAARVRPSGEGRGR